jgi:glycosyltransferase involved in cell wall biosynthesis
MRIALLEPFFTGSHRRWAEGWQACSRHDIRCLTLPGRHWKWRMHGGAVALATQLLAMPEPPDLLVASDMLDVAALAGLIRARYPQLPIVLYMHENQLTYPWSPTDRDVKLRRDRHYAWINYTSALVADRVYFNSHYHRESFIEALPKFLRAFPDHQELEKIASIAAKSEVLPLGMNLQNLLMQTANTEHKSVPHLRQDDGSPVLLWNHRWEYDKNPEGFFELCYALLERGFAFQLVVLGEAYAKAPSVFERARTRLATHILHWGYAKSTDHYAYWLQRADLYPVTSFQDFFGGSVVEAIAAGCYPLLPKRLAYPEHIPEALRSQHLYDSPADLLQRASTWLQSPEPPGPKLAAYQQRYDWESIVQQYDEQVVQFA